MANKYKGEVEFQDSNLQTFVLRLGTNQYISVQAVVDKLEGREWQRFMLHLALIHGAESQKDLTLDDAGEILDDIGYVKADELITQTKFGLNAKQAADEAKKRRAADKAAAAQAVVDLVGELRETELHSGGHDTILMALDRLEAKAQASVVQANPPTPATSSSN